MSNAIASAVKLGRVSFGPSRLGGPAVQVTKAFLTATGEHARIVAGTGWDGIEGKKYKLAEFEKAFAAAFAGYTLYVNREVRSLDVQIERWNSNASVDAASRTLLDDLRVASAQRARAKRADWLRDSLTSWTLAVPVTLAAPGLSAHGQSRAFDFQVERDGAIVAGTEAEHATRDWDAAGWTERLKQVVARASTRLRGPLETPREPWHYYYDAGVSAPADGVHGPCE